MKKNININKAAYAVIVLNCIQVISVLGLILYSFFIDPSLLINKNLFQYFVFILIILIAFLNSFITVRDSLHLINFDLQYKSVKDSLYQVENLNRSLRAQRHDFMNHLQVVYSLMEMNEYTEATDYIDKVYKDIQKVSRILKTANPAINALLQAKMLACEQRGIKMELNIASSLKDIHIPVWELCRVIGNLIDNSIYALKNIHTERKIIINLFEDLKSYSFRISNNGPIIPIDITQKIFDSGFSTKGDKGDGMGLSIIKEIVTEYDGNIKLSSSDKITYFEVDFPKLILRQ
jgi:two-component system, LytTR family, sensor histidine kinase AgrC